MARDYAMSDSVQEDGDRVRCQAYVVKMGTVGIWFGRAYDNLGEWDLGSVLP